MVLGVVVSVPVGGKNATVGVVRLAVIAPVDHDHEQSLNRVLPAVQLAVRKVADPVTGYLPGWDILVDHRDSRCSSTFGPLAAFEFYINRSAGTQQMERSRRHNVNMLRNSAHYPMHLNDVEKFYDVNTGNFWSNVCSGVIKWLRG